MIRAVIFDLDNCLSAGRSVPEEVYRPGFEAIRQANRGELTEEQLDAAFSDSWRYAVDDVAARHGFSAEMKAAAMQAFAKAEVIGSMSGYADLDLLSQIPTLRFLVTSGFRRLQESKIRALGIGSLFAAIYVDAIDESARAGKYGLFNRILETHDLAAAEVLVVGDNPDSEIEAGNRLGCRTIQILRPGVERGTNAWRYLENLSQLQELITNCED